MRAIDQFQFYLSGQHIHPLEGLSDDALLKDWWYPMWTAANWLEFLISNALIPLVVSQDAARKLLGLLRQVTPKNFTAMPDLEKKMEEAGGSFYAYNVKEALREFETVFAAEMRVLPTYAVRQKGIYQTEMLIDHAEQAFTDATRKVIPDTVLKDFREAGRCLAFELPTASGFHVMRATEGVLRKYHALVKKHPTGVKSPEWAVCVNEIKAGGGNPKVTAILDQIRGLHRNPTMHPEDFLNLDEALALFDVAKSAIAAMATEIIDLETQAAAAVPAPVVAPAIPAQTGP